MYNFKLTTLTFDALAFCYGDSEATAKGKLDNFLNLQEIKDAKLYRAGLSISQRGVKNYIHLAYATVVSTTSGTKDVQILKFDHHNFLASTINANEFLNYENETFQEELKTFLKDHDLKMDISRVALLVEENGAQLNIYIPYRRK